jgi:hypothetical protein
MSEPSKTWWLRGSLVLPVLVLVTAIAIQGVKFFHEAPKPHDPHLDQAVPLNLPGGWTGADLPLGANEAVDDAVEKILNYDAVLYREFNRGGESFGVYVAYWGAGKMPTRLVASHTPDRCWTENGWRCLAMKFKQPETFEGVTMQPAEWREFEPPLGGSPTYVLYWHLVEGHLYDYGNRFNNVPSPYLWWKDAVQQAVLGSREQYFIRLTSTEPLENLWSDPGFAVVLRGLGRLGLVKPPVTAGN